MLNISSNSPSDPQHRLQSLKLLVYKHPFAVCGGLWVALVLLGGAATLGLINPGPSDKGGSQPLPPLTTFEQVTPQPPSLKKLWKKTTPIQPPVASQQESTPERSPFTTVEQSPVEAGSPKQDLPLFLIGAVALGCAGGSLLLTQLLKQSAESYQTPRPLTPVKIIRKKRRHPSQRNPSVAREPQQVSSQPNVQTVNKPMAMPERNLTQVTILPPEQRHPLDGGKENLAEMMDLRKRQSLASLMRNKW